MCIRYLHLHLRRLRLGVRLGHVAASHGGSTSLGLLPVAHDATAELVDDDRCVDRAANLRR